mgnify:CR=1 FL=1
MDATKPWYLSRTIWASFVTIAMSLAGLFGFSTAGIDGSSLTDTLLQAISGIAGIVAITGRFDAAERLAQAMEQRKHPDLGVLGFGDEIRLPHGDFGAQANPFVTLLLRPRDCTRIATQERQSPRDGFRHFL